MTSNAELYQQMAQSIIDGDAERADDLATSALAAGVDPLEAAEEGLISGIKTVGELFQQGEYFLPHLIAAGEAMRTGMSVLEPEIARRHLKRQSVGKVLLGTVAGDIHDLGKSLVKTMLVASGFEVADLGVDVPVETWVAGVRELKPQIVGLSALMTLSMPEQGKIIEALKSNGLRDEVKVMVGGAPVTQQWSDRIGADGFGPDAIGAVLLARQLLGKG